MSYFAAFASLTALVVHCYLFHGADIVRQWKASRRESVKDASDVHARLMRRYPEVPTSWYLILFATCLAVALYVVQSGEVALPFYGLLLALAICAIFFVPMGMINAIANQNASTALLCQLICGALFPGRPIANMVFLTYGYIGGMQGIRFAADMKIGTYSKCCTWTDNCAIRLTHRSEDCAETIIQGAVDCNDRWFTHTGRGAQFSVRNSARNLHN